MSGMHTMVFASGKVKNIDTLYISEALVKDAMSFDFSKSYSFYSQQFDQIGHNYRRIATIRNERIDRAAFIVHCAIMERYFAGMSLKDDSFFRTELEGAVKSRNYSLYKLVNNLLYA